jgi:ketosteroid isomerase-like protein
VSLADIVGTRFEAEEAAVRRRLDEILDVVSAKDFDRLAGYHLDSPKFTKFDDFEPLERQDVATANRLEAEGLGGVERFQGVFDELQVDVFGRVAVATAVFRYGFEADGESVALRARTTLVFVDDRGDWKIAHEHLSPFKANP